MKLMKFVINPMLKYAVSRMLVGRVRYQETVQKGRFTKSDIKSLIKKTWTIFGASYSDLSKETNISSKMSIFSACITISFYKALLEYGLTKEYAIQLVGDVSWFIYKKLGYIPLIISKIMSRNKLKRIKICTDLIRKFPFNPPGYEMKDVNCCDTVAYDVEKCIIASYFLQKGEIELCKETWCKMDYALAELWGGELERTSTISCGHDRCDFRFKIRP